MSQDARPTLASKGCGQPCSPLLCKDRPASSREAPSVAGPSPSPRSRTGRRGRPAPRAAGRGLRRVRAWPLGAGSRLLALGLLPPTRSPGRVARPIYVMVFMGSRHARCTQGAGRPPPMPCPAQEALTRDCGALSAVGSSTL